MVRVLGPEMRLLLSDVTAATDWPIARSVVDHLELPLPDDDEDQEPAGDLGIVADLGMGADGHGCAARRPRPLPRRDARPTSRRELGFGRQYDELVGVSTSPVTRVVRAVPGTAPMREALARGACGAGHGRRTHRRGGDRPRRRSDRPRPQPARGRRATPPPTPRSSRCARPRQARGEWRLTGCTLVVTLEPCTMCAGAVVLSRVDRLVFGAYDEKAGAVGSLWDVVRDRRLNHRPEVMSGVLADEATALLHEFFAAHREVDADSPPVPSAAVACPSGLRSTPRKRVWVHALRGFKSHRHRHSVSAFCSRPTSRRAALPYAPARSPGMDGPHLHPYDCTLVLLGTRAHGGGR